MHVAGQLVVLGEPSPPRPVRAQVLRPSVQMGTFTRAHPVDRVVDSIEGRRIGHATVTDIESITAARRRMDDALGGGSLPSAVREDLRVSINLLTRASYSAEVRVATRYV